MVHELRRRALGACPCAPARLAWPWCSRRSDQEPAPAMSRSTASCCRRRPDVGTRHERGGSRQERDDRRDLSGGPSGRAASAPPSSP
jgi:hypothetical protein